MAAAKGGYDFGYHNYNTAPENNVSNGISGPTPLPPTPSLNEKNKFTRCPLPPEFINLVDDDVRDSRVPHQQGPHGKLHPTSSMNPFNPGFTPHSVPTSSGQQTLRISQPNASPCYSNVLPQMKPYQYEPHLPGRTNQSGLVFSDMSVTDFLNGTVPDTGSPLTSKLPDIGRCRSEIGANLMTTPQTSSCHAIQQNISNNSHDHFPTYSMPPYSRQLDCSSLPLDSDFSRINFEMLPQRGGLMTRPDIRYPSVTTSPQVGSFQFEKPQYGRMQPDLGFPSSIMSSPAGFCHPELDNVIPREQPNSLTNGLCMGSSHMVMTQLTNSAHIEHQECSTTQSGTGTSFPNMVLMQPQETSHQNSALLTTPNPKPSSAPDILTQESEAEGRPYQEVIPTEEVATNQVASENHGIDLNKTPQQKPRRRKYVPKVITPGKKTRAPKKTTPKKDSEDRPKRKYVRKKVVEPPATEAPVNAVGADKPVGNSNSFTQNNSNQSGGADKQTEGSNSCTPIAVNVQNKAAEVPMPCTPSVTTGLSKPTNSSNPCTNIMMQVPDHCSVSGMSAPSKPVRRRLDFDAQEVRTDGYKHTQSQPNLTPFLADPLRRDISTLPMTSSSIQVGPSPSKGISLDLNSTANWQEEFDHLFPPTPSTSTASQLQTIRSTNPMPTNLDNFTGYPYPPVPNQTNSSIAAPKRPVNHCLGTYNENFNAQAKNNESSQIGAYSNAAILTPDGRKREYSALLNNTCLPAQVRPQVSPLIIETSKKTRICNGYNTGQKGTAYNAPVFHNSSSILPSLRPDGRMFSLADAQRLVELQKRNKTNMLSFRVPEGNTEMARTVPSGSGIASTSSTPVSQPQAVNGSSMARIYQSGVSVQTFVERTTILNHRMNTSGNLPCRPVAPVVSGVNGATLEMITGRGNMNATNANVRNASCQIGATTQTISETTTEKPVPGNCIQPSTPAKSPTLNASSKSEPKRRGRRPNSEKLGAQPPVPPRPRGRPPSEKSSINSTNLMVGGSASLAYTLDSIIQKMSRLDINRVFEAAPVQGLVQPSFALVPYQGGFKDGSIVLYDNVMVKKKRKSRAQVDLDPVTSQVWNLLMGKEMKIGIETVNENDEKKMEAEREVFRGRIDSFIARMHLVQGDRRFSKWKGSVVDSVVGVFLTQNVSDHLSSSAFMALAAKYPVKTRPNNSEARESTLSVSRHHNTNPYARDFINLTKWHRQREVIIEDFTDIGSQVTSEEKDSNGSQDSTTKGPGSSPEKKPTGSPDSGPGLVINFLNDDPASDGVVSSQNSVITNQSSPDHPFQTAEQNLPGLGLFGNYRADGHVGDASLPVSGFVGTRPESYTQLLRMAESSGVGFSSDLNKVTGGAGVDVCSYSNVSQLYSQNGNICPGTPPKFSNSNMNHLQNGVYPPPAAPTMVSGNKIVQTQTQDNELRTGLHSSVVSQTPEPVTPMIKITTTSGQNHGYIPVQQEKKIYPPPVQLPQPHAPSTPSTSNLKNAPNANNNRNTDASSETVQGKQPYMAQKALDGTVIDDGVSSKGNSKKGKGASGRAKKNFDWDSLRRAVCPDGVKKERTHKTMDSLDYEALRNASVRELSDAIRERGMNNMLAERIKGFLDRLVNDHGSIDLEWLRDVDPDKAKDYLLSIRGLGLKSVECVRLLTLHHMAFPVDTNVGRICVRLGWVPLQPLPESLQLHLLEMYPILENIQKYLWPRLCKFDQRTLYELHYQMITFGKVFCTKSKPNCNACPMRAECKHFASAFASARLALPAPEEKGLATTAALPSGPSTSTNLHSPFPPSAPLPQIEGFSTSSSSLPIPFPYPIPANLPFQNQPQSLLQPRVSHPTVTPTQTRTQTCNEPIIEEPASPEPEPVAEKEIGAIEDAFLEEDPDEIPTIKLDFKEFTQNLKNYIQANNLEIEDTNMSKAMVAISPEAASLPVPKLKNVSRLRTEHQVYELPDNHTLLAGFEPREPDDPSPYLLSIWTPGETAMSTEPPKSLCISQDVDELCDKEACARCASIKEARSRIVRGTILIPCRTAMRGSFPLNGTYFQVNEVFADHESSRNPIEISRAWIWNLPRRTVYFGTSIPTIFKGQSTEGIQHCFWRGFVCVRGFERATRAPRPLYARLHFPASKVARNGRKPAAAAKNEE